MILPNVPDVTAMIGALDQARTIDFVSYVNRRMREDRAIELLRFKTGWNAMVGSYALMAAQNHDAPGEGNEGA